MELPLQEPLLHGLQSHVLDERGCGDGDGVGESSEEREDVEDRLVVGYHLLFGVILLVVGDELQQLDCLVQGGG